MFSLESYKFLQTLTHSTKQHLFIAIPLSFLIPYFFISKTAELQTLWRDFFIDLEIVIDLET